MSSSPASATRNPGVVVEGRHAATPEGVLRFGFPGAVLHLGVRAPVVSIRIHAYAEDAYLAVSEGPGSPVCLRIPKGEDSYILPLSRDPGARTIRVLRRTESWQGTFDVLGWDFPEGGGWASVPLLPERKLLFIGDSITGGEATDRPTGEVVVDSPGAVARVSNAGASFGRVLADRLGAQCHLVSYGGRGILRDWQGIRDTVNAPQFYERALPDDPETAWNHRLYVPDVVVIGLGTNDFSQGIPDQNDFVNTYIAFLEKVCRDFPDTPVLLLDSPILEDEESRAPKRSALRGYLDEIRNKARRLPLHCVRLSHAQGVPGDGHPTAAEHRVMADEIEPELRRLLKR